MAGAFTSLAADPFASPVKAEQGAAVRASLVPPPRKMVAGTSFKDTTRNRCQATGIASHTAGRCHAVPPGRRRLPGPGKSGFVAMKTVDAARQALGIPT